MTASALSASSFWRAPRGPIPWRCVWPGALGALILPVGAVVNELRFEGRRA